MIDEGYNLRLLWLGGQVVVVISAVLIDLMVLVMSHYFEREELQNKNCRKDNTDIISARYFFLSCHTKKLEIILYFTADGMKNIALSRQIEGWLYSLHIYQMTLPHQRHEDPPSLPPLVIHTYINVFEAIVTMICCQGRTIWTMTLQSDSEALMRHAAIFWVLHCRRVMFKGLRSNIDHLYSSFTSSIMCIHYSWYAEADW